MKTDVLRFAAPLLTLAFLCSQAGAAAVPPPAWWSARGLYRINPQTNQPYPAEDYRQANIGQLKHFMTAAVAEIDASLPGGATPALRALVNGWQNPAPPPAPQSDDYAGVNIGQLKYCAKLLYDCLAPTVVPGILPPNPYPWTPEVIGDEDFAAANLGQLKRLFDFDLVNRDRDGDGLSDLAELLYTRTDPSLADTNGDGKPDGLEDSNANGICNLDELAFGLNPATNSATQSQLQSAYSYDRLGRLLGNRDLSAAAQTISIDEEGNITSIR